MLSKCCSMLQYVVKATNMSISSSCDHSIATSLWRSWRPTEIKMLEYKWLTQLACRWDQIYMARKQPAQSLQYIPPCIGYRARMFDVHPVLAYIQRSLGWWLVHEHNRFPVLYSRFVDHRMFLEEYWKLWVRNKQNNILNLNQLNFILVFV